MEVRRRTSQQNAYYWGTVIPIIQLSLVKLGHNLANKQVHLYLKNKFIPMVATTYNIPPDYFMVGGSYSTRKMSVHHWDTYKILIQEFAATILNTQIPDPNEQQEDCTQDIV